MAETRNPEELSPDELDAQDGEQLPDREVMSVIRAEPELPYIPPPDDPVTIQPVDPATE